MLCIIAVASIILTTSFMLKGDTHKRIRELKKGFSMQLRPRPVLWKEAASIIKAHPLLGTGPNTYAFVAPNYQLKDNTGTYPHNSYLQLAAEIGLIGLWAFLWIIFRFFFMAISALKKYRDPFLLSVMCSLIAYLTHSFLDVNLFAAQFAILFWVILGLGMARIKNLESS